MSNYTYFRSICFLCMLISVGFGILNYIEGSMIGVKFQIALVVISGIGVIYSALKVKQYRKKLK